MHPPPIDAPSDRIAFNLRGWNPRPAFLVGPGWLPHIFSIRMEPHWRQIDAGGRCRDYLGTNYVLFPTPTAGRPWTAHFEPTSPYFHAFFGVYILPPVDGERVPPEVFGELGSRDNVAWSRSMGDPEPASRWEGPAPLEAFEHDAAGHCTKWRFTITYRMHADLGTNNPRSGLPEVLRAPPVGSGWEREIRPYLPMRLTSRGFLWYEGDYLVINYFNGIEFEDLRGRRVDTYEDWPEFRAELLRMAAGVRIFNDGSGFSCPPPGGLLSLGEG